MAKPEKRWQLLLVADDGRIIPFKRIKGLALTLVILLVLLGLVCAGLGWQLTAEKVRHRRTHAELAATNRQLDRYKNENELITAELVLAEARMEKAGLTVAKRRERMPQQPVSKIAANESTVDAAVDDQAATTAPSPEFTAANPDTAPSPAQPSAEMAPAGATDSSALNEKKPTVSPTVALGELALKHDTEKQTLLARFRVVKNDPQSSRVAGQCVVVLRSNRLAPSSWQAMPALTLKDGIPDGTHGRKFDIANYITMEIMAPVVADPSAFDTAVVYVFDPSGGKILEKTFPIDLPSPKPVPQTAATAAAQPAAEPERPAVALAAFKITHDAAEQTLMARFRVKNTGSSAAPVGGRCVVVLKSDTLEPKRWLAMPGVALVNGRPDGNRGQAFRISRFKDMQIKTRGVTDPSVFDTAAVFVFDTGGTVILETDFPVNFPAPEPVSPSTPPPGPQPADTSDIPDSQAAPAVAVDAQPIPVDEVEAATGNQPTTQPVDTPAPAATPKVPADLPNDDDPSLTEGIEPTSQEDSRSRF
jgi:hypothetical protein